MLAQSPFYRDLLDFFRRLRVPVASLFTVCYIFDRNWEKMWSNVNQRGVSGHDAHDVHVESGS